MLSLQDVVAAREGGQFKKTVLLLKITLRVVVGTISTSHTGALESRITFPRALIICRNPLERRPHAKAHPISVRGEPSCGRPKTNACSVET